MLGAVVDANASQSLTPPRPPLSVTVSEPPGETELALMVKVGAWLTVKFTGADVPPPGPGVNTVTCAVPTAATSAAEIAACRLVLLTNVVGRAAPFQRTTESDMKLLPVTVSVSPGPPTLVLLGDSAVTSGAGRSDGSTVMVGLVAPRVKPSFKNSRNS